MLADDNILIACMKLHIYVVQAAVGCSLEVGASQVCGPVLVDNDEDNLAGCSGSCLHDMAEVYVKDVRNGL